MNVWPRKDTKDAKKKMHSNPNHARSQSPFCVFFVFSRPFLPPNFSLAAFASVALLLAAPLIAVPPSTAPSDSNPQMQARINALESQLSNLQKELATSEAN